MRSNGIFLFFFGLLSASFGNAVPDDVRTEASWLRIQKRRVPDDQQQKRLRESELEKCVEPVAGREMVD